MAEMPQDHMMRSLLIQLPERLTAGFIAQMSMPPEYTGLQGRRIMFIGTKHTYIMIAFQQQYFHAGQRFQRLFCEYPDISRSSYTVPAIIDTVSDRLGRIMRDRIRQYAQILDIKAFTRLKGTMQLGVYKEQVSLQCLASEISEYVFPEK